MIETSVLRPESIRHVSP